MKNSGHLLSLIFAWCVLVCAGCTSSVNQAEKLYETGMQDLQAGSLDTAITEFSQAIQLNPKLAEAYVGRATANAALRHFAEAISDYNQAIELDPVNEQAFFQRGAVRAQVSDLTGAVDDFSRAIELNTNDAKAYMGRGLTLVVMENFDGGMTDLDAAINLDPKLGTAFRSRAAVEIMLRDYEKGLADASKAIELGDADELTYRFRGTVKTLLRDHRGAMEDMSKSIELAPGDATAYADRASIEIFWDDFSNADADIKMAFQIDPDCEAAFQKRAAMERKQGDNEEALADYKRALAPPVSLSAPEIHIALGHVENDLGQWNDALGDLKNGLVYYPDRGYDHFTIFLIQSRLGETNEAQMELNSYVKSIPPSRTNEWQAGIANFLLGDASEEELIDEATTRARRPTDLPAQQCEAYYYAGMKRLLAGDKAGATEQFQKCLATGEENQYEYKSARAELQALKKR